MSDHCAICKTNIDAGGVFVAGVGSICFDCDRIEFLGGGEDEKCQTCKGTGTINALTPTRRQGPFIASYGDCPDCDGTGEAF